MQINEAIEVLKQLKDELPQINHKVFDTELSDDLEIEKEAIYKAIEVMEAYKMIGITKPYLRTIP